MSRTPIDIELLERRVAEGFSRAELPGAPAGLRAEVAALVSAPRVRSGREWRPSSFTLMRLAVAVAVIALVAVALPALRTQLDAGHASPTPTLSEPVPTVVPSGTRISPHTLVPSPTPALPTTPSPFPSFNIPVLPDGPSITWTPISLDEFGTNVTAAGAAQLGGRILVVATADGANGVASAPVILSSTDGSAWQRVPTDGPDFKDAFLERLMAIPGGLLLVGQSQTSYPIGCAGAAGCNPVSKTLMWTSSDGISWKSVPAAKLSAFDRVWITTMASGPNGISAFGTWFPMTGSANKTFVFHSTDGISWSFARFPDDAYLAQTMAATAAGFVSVGGDNAVGLAWYSSDGLTWKRAASFSDGGCAAHSLAVGAQGMYAKCTRGWSSTDGRIWKEAADSPDNGLSGPTAWTTGNGSEILIVTGQDAFWSTDGETWHLGKSTPGLPNLGSGSGSAWILPSAIVVSYPGGLSIGRVG